MELQVDANMSLKEMSEKLKINYKKLAWHYSTHVLGRGLIRSYKVNWMGTAVDVNTERLRHKPHKYYICVLLVKYINEIEKMTVRQKVNGLPFLWAEAGGNNFYAELAFPVESVTEGFQYLEKAIESVREKAEILTVDQTNSVTFAIPWMMYQDESGWVFNKAELLAKFQNLILEIRKSNPVGNKN